MAIVNTNLTRKKIVTLWSNDNANVVLETGNGGNRRLLCPASARFSELPGLSALANRQNWVGGVGTTRTEDYIAGMPDLRWEHLFVVDCEGYDYLTLEWYAEIVSIAQNWVVDHAGMPSNTAIEWSDQSMVWATGLSVIEDSLGFVTFPAAVLHNANNNNGVADQLFNEGTGGRPRPMIGSSAAVPIANDCHFAAAGLSLCVYAPTSTAPPGGESSGLGAGYAIANRCPTLATNLGGGFFDWGVSREDAGGVAFDRLMRVGDRRAARFRLGHPTAGNGPQSMTGVSRNLESDLRITGLARIFFAIGSVGPNRDASTRLTTTAPDFNIAGRLYGILGKY